MINTLKALEHEFNSILLTQNIKTELNIHDVVENYQDYEAEFKLAVTLLNRAIKELDKVAIQCILTRVRIAALNLSNLYQDVIDDAISINKDESWPEIPENYKLVDHYENLCELHNK